MKIREVHSKSILSRSKIFDYVINPYVGCQHACSYCYAKFMKRFTGHKEPWGDFVDIKINAPDLLTREIRKKPSGTVWVSGVCDPYQPLEEKYRLSRQCLHILVQNDWPVTVQTRSPLVLRDMDIFRQSRRIEVGLSITTADDDVRKQFEPNTSSIPERLKTIAALHQNGIRNYVMIAPVLPGAEHLVKTLAGKVDSIIIDRMNYRHADKICKKCGWRDMNSDDYFRHIQNLLTKECMELGIECRSAF